MQHKKTKHTIAEGQRASRCFQWHLLFPELLIGQLLNSEGNSGKDWTCVFPRVVDRAIVDVQGHLGEKSSFCFFLSFWQGSCFFPREARGKKQVVGFYPVFFMGKLLYSKGDPGRHQTDIFPRVCCWWGSFLIPKRIHRQTQTSVFPRDFLGAIVGFQGKHRVKPDVCFFP